MTDVSKETRRGRPRGRGASYAWLAGGSATAAGIVAMIVEGIRRAEGNELTSAALAGAPRPRWRAT